MDKLITMGGVLLTILIMYLLVHLTMIVLMLCFKAHELINNFIEWLYKKLFSDRR